MKKLDDIPKKSVFKVPDGYFEQLPTVIQARMQKDSGRSAWSGVFGFSVKYALPAIALSVALLLWFRPEPSVEKQLGEIDANQVALYLDHAYSADIIIGDEETGEWTEAELNDLEDEVYSDMEYTNAIDDILNDVDL